MELSYNTWTDVTADWVTAVPLVIERGMEPGERVAQVGRMGFALHSPDGRYVPGHADVTPGFEAGIGARLRAHDGTQAHTLFTGRIEAIRPRREAASRRPVGPDAVEVMCADDMAALGRVAVGTFPLVIDAAPGDLVDRLVRLAATPPGRLGYWRLDHPQAGALGQGTRLSGASTGVDIDAGQSVFPWAGDTWPAGLAAAEALRDVCASEGGFFHIAADGTPTFRDRHARPARVAADGVLAGSLAGLVAAHEAARIASRVEVTTHPRAAGTSAEVLWEAGRAIALLPGQALTVACAFTDPDGRAAQVGAASVMMPVPGTDFTATTAADGTGTDVTASVRVSVQAGARRAVLALSSAWAGGTAYVHNLRLRGVALRSYHPATSATEDTASRFDYGLRLLRVDMPLQDDARVGEDMARALLMGRHAAHPWLVVTVEATASQAMLVQALAREVGDRLHITDGGLALDAAAVFIDGIAHTIERGGDRHRVVWRTSPADLAAWWALGATAQSAQSALGSATRLGY
jgi:hypothetical protein